MHWTRRRLHDLSTWSATRVGDRRGGVAIIVAILVVALIGMMALAMDVSAAVSAHTRLREAADVAALTAVRQAAVLTAANSDADLSAAEAAGQQRFLAQASNNPNVTLNNVSVQVVRNGLTITSTVKFDASYATQVANVLNALSPSMTSFVSLPLGGQAGGKQQIGGYVDIQVLMDVSNSMTIAATDQAATALQNMSSTWFMWIDPGYRISMWANCNFACHAKWTPGWKFASGSDYNQPAPSGATDFYTLAHALGIPLRIDVVKQAVGSIITAMVNADPGTSTGSSKFRFGFYTFDNDTTQVYQLGSAGSAAPVVAATDVNPTDYCRADGTCVAYQTDVTQSITDFGNYVIASGTGGDGSSQAKSKKFALIITDGVNDHFGDGPNGRVTTTFDPTSCQRLKDNNISIIVLQAATASQFDTNDGSDPVTAFNKSVAAMQTCASSGLYFLASSPSDIQAATRAIISLVLTQPTLITQGASSLTAQ